MGSRWRKLKLAIGFNLCVYAPDDDSSSPNNFVTGLSNVSSSPCNGLSRSPTSIGASHPPTTPTPSSSGLRLFKSGSKSLSKSFKGICAICLATIKPGNGHAIFTAECSHSFHFHCITSNVKHGNQICPVCRAKWKEVPLQNSSTTVSFGISRIGEANFAPDDAWMNVARGLPSPQAEVNRQSSSFHQTPEPSRFDDDEALCQQNFPTLPRDNADYANTCTMKIKTYPEVSAVSRSASQDNFAVLVHLKAPSGRHRDRTISSQMVQDSRAPVDLVTVLDVSGSMAGTKLALLKRAMNFVIQNLGPSDRLSVIAFSSTARRILPLKRMTDTGRQEALHAINSLVSNGGTNIADALRKGAKVFLDQKEKNPVGSIILLSDGQDTYTVNRCGTEHQSLVPTLINRNNGGSLQIPVHAFGFGADHDATAMHSISEMSGGTFSFIETESVIQDAFAQCIGGLLSVVLQELKVKVECTHPGLLIGSVKAGSYQTDIMSCRKLASVDIGDLYAEEERDFLVTVNIPADESANELSLLSVSCVYRDPVTKEMVTSVETSEVKIQRPYACGKQLVSMEVDRQRNRLRAAEVMAEARVAAEQGDLAGAVSILDSCRKALSDTASGQAGDRLCLALSAELKEMQERMANRRLYEESGRAYILSGLSSHSWQRATARGDSTGSTNLEQAYQTPSMVDMVNRSRTMILGSTSSHKRSLQPFKTFPARSRKAGP